MPTRRSVSPCGPSTLAEAQAALARREVFGILDIPAGTEREVLEGRRARLPAYVDSAYFLLYNRTLQGILEGTNAVMTDLLSRDARPDGSLYRAALLQELARRGPQPAAVQSDRRLCQLHRSGRLHADPAADAAHGVGDAGRRRLRAGRTGRSPPPRRSRRRPRPGPGALPARPSGSGAVPRRAAAPLRRSPPPRGWSISSLCSFRSSCR